MTYDDLLTRQEQEREQFDRERFGDLFKLTDRQKAAPDPASFEPAKQQLIDLYKQKDAELIVRHQKERNTFLRVPEPAQPPPPQPIKDLTDPAAELLERYRQRQRDRSADRDGPER